MIIEIIELELDECKNKHKPFCSTHEGYGILLEEVDELWDEIKKSKDYFANKRMVDEAIQVAAMAIKFIENLYKKRQLSKKGE